MRPLIRLIRIYTPFICTLMALVNGVKLLSETATENFLYMSSATTGFSILVVTYFFAVSERMCIWYKLNLLCLLGVQLCGIAYNYLDIDMTLYANSIVLLSALGIVTFLVFRVFYQVTSLFGCNRRHLLRPRLH